MRGVRTPADRPLDASVARVPGPWEHHMVAANGARFHVAVAGDGPLVLLLHGFPQFWWSWRHQLPALADAGYRVAAAQPMRPPAPAPTTMARRSPRARIRPVTSAARVNPS